MRSTCVLLQLTLYLSAAGYITPKTTNPIFPTYNNAQYVADYTFKFQLETPTSVTSTLAIEFPDSYPDNLGSGTCTTSDEKGNAYASCTILNKTVTVLIGALSSSPKIHTYGVTVTNITNPTLDGGSGWFRLKTYKGVNLLDWSDMFGIIGIKAEALVISSGSVVCSEACTPATVGTYTV
jgi:hypothetical protein